MPGKASGSDAGAAFPASGTAIAVTGAIRPGFGGADATGPGNTGTADATETTRTGTTGTRATGTRAVVGAAISAGSSGRATTPVLRTMRRAADRDQHTVLHQLRPAAVTPALAQFLNEWIGAGIRPPRVTNASHDFWFTGMIGA